MGIMAYSLLWLMQDFISSTVGLAGESLDSELPRDSNIP